MYSKIINEVDVHLLGGCTLNIDEEKRTKEIMSLQAITLAPGGVEAIVEKRQAHNDLSSRGTDRESSREVAYPVPVSIRIIHAAFVVGTVVIIGMLMFG